MADESGDILSIEAILISAVIAVAVAAILLYIIYGKKERQMPIPVYKVFDNILQTELFPEGTTSFEEASSTLACPANPPDCDKTLSRYFGNNYAARLWYEFDNSTPHPKHYHTTINTASPVLAHHDTPQDGKDRIVAWENGL